MKITQTNSTLDIQRIPVNNQIDSVGALTSLLALPGGTILVGTTTVGNQMPVLLQFDPWTRQITDTGVRFPSKGTKGGREQCIGDKIHDALIWGNDKWEGWCLTGHGSHIWWDEGGWPFSPEVFPGGAIYAWNPETKELCNLGIPVQNNTVHGLYGGDGFAVGYSLPDNHFFSFDYETGDMIDLGRISAYCCHSFICHGQKAYGVYRRSVGEQRGDEVVADDSAAFLLVYDHQKREIKRTEIMVSELNTNIRFNSGIDSWSAWPGKDILVGGRVNGSLFELDTNNNKLKELGSAVEKSYPQLDKQDLRKLGGKLCKSILGNERIPAIKPLDENTLIGVAGFPTMHIFLLKSSGEKIDLGPVNTDAPMCYFHSLAIAQRGQEKYLVLAETDAKPDIYLARFPL